MKTYEIRCETLHTLYLNYTYKAKDKKDAIAQFKKEKGKSLKNIKATLIPQTQ